MRQHQRANKTCADSSTMLPEQGTCVMYAWLLAHHCLGASHFQSCAVGGHVLEGLEPGTQGLQRPLRA